MDFFIQNEMFSLVYNRVSCFLDAMPCCTIKYKTTFYFFVNDLLRKIDKYLSNTYSAYLILQLCNFFLKKKFLNILINSCILKTGVFPPN